MIDVLVVGYGLAGKSFHIPLIRRQPGLRLAAVATRDTGRRTEAEEVEEVPTAGSLAEAIERFPDISLVVIATPHDTHPELVVASLDAGKDCVVDKVMCLTTPDADRMIEARDRSGRMLSVFHNRRWDWDYLALKSVIASGEIGTPVLFESSVCRYAPPRTWRGRAVEAGTILHDWGAHLVDQALQLGLGPCRSLRASLVPAPWPGVDIGGHGRILMQFDGCEFLAETSRICPLDRPRWWVVGTEGGFVRLGVDPQEDALRGGDLGRAGDPEGHRTFLRTVKEGKSFEREGPKVAGSWDSYYANIVAHLTEGADLEVTAEQSRETVRVLEAAALSADNRAEVAGPWGFPARPRS